MELVITEGGGKLRESQQWGIGSNEKESSIKMTGSEEPPSADMCPFRRRKLEGSTKAEL